MALSRMALRGGRMPSAASQLISLDLFSGGQRNDFDLASPCNGFFALLVGFELIDLRSCCSGVPAGFSIQ